MSSASSSVSISPKSLAPACSSKFAIWRSCLPSRNPHRHAAPTPHAGDYVYGIATCGSEFWSISVCTGLVHRMPSNRKAGSRMIRQAVVILTVCVLALTVAGCGGGTATTTRAASPARLSASEQRQLSAGVAQFSRAITSKAQRSDVAFTATSMAGALSQMAAAHVGTALSGRLLAASDAWLKLSNAILTGTAEGINAAERIAEAREAALK